VRPVRLLIVDLDNTLYDWVTFFARSFRAMVDSALPIIGVSRDQALDELKAVHQRHHNSEQPFALLETPSARAAFAGFTRTELAKTLDPAFQAFNEERRRTLFLYPGVKKTLEVARAAHCEVVAHTEATAVNAASRLRHLGLAQLIDRLYGVQILGEGHPDPSYRGGAHEFAGRIRLLKPDERKPDTRVVLDICRDYAIEPAEALYVGDSLSRDIGMAKEAGLATAWAKYGTLYDRKLWDDLVRITHWTQEDVERTQRAAELYRHVVADVVLENGFDEILQHFDFASTA
jgi:FMN phosphatase YigB (HAD superfamily)